MRLPGHDRVVVDAAKIRDYLLSDSHPIGRFKAPFFLALGYSRDDWQRLENDLRGLASIGDAQAAEENPYGQKYLIRGTLKGPTGRMRTVMTVWIVLRGEDFARFVTAFPE